MAGCGGVLKHRIMVSTPESCSLLNGRASVLSRWHDPEERTLRTLREGWW
jgi:hypothetical protein